MTFERVVIGYGVAVQEDHPRGKGWRPIVIENGRESWDWGRPLGRDEAQAAAYERAMERAGRYLGDFAVVLEPLPDEGRIAKGRLSLRGLRGVRRRAACKHGKVKSGPRKGQCRLRPKRRNA